MIMAEGGRRSGKTTGSLAIKIVLCLICFWSLPGEVLSPTYRQSMNVWRAVSKHVPRAWWASRLKSEKLMTMVNGSSVRLLSADNPDAARSEGVAWGAYDERQDIGEEAAANAFLSTSEAGESEIVCIFETATVKPELREHHDKLEAAQDGAIYSMDSYGNPFISKKFLDIAAQFLDQEMIDRELHAKWPELKGRIYHTWHQDDHLRSWPLLHKTDATAQILRRRFGRDAPHLIGIDPPHSAVAFKIYSDDTMHAVGDVVVNDEETGGDVRDLARICGQRWPGAIVVIDPHDTEYASDLHKYCKREGLHVRAVKRMRQEYKLTSVRARAEINKLFVDPVARYYASTLAGHLYDKKGKPDLVQVHKGSKIQMVHIGDGGAYAIYKMFPSEQDYERLERQQRKQAA
ncbi:MAG: hypothetical protein GY835_24040 [bacterium]|nr:hypothetical protein [bacterium]